jgi:hypothetical protein
MAQAEDRALLGSNSSAVLGAETGGGERRSLSSRSFSGIGTKRQIPGVWGQSPLAFHEAACMSPSRWHLCLRLNKARRLLQSPHAAHLNVTAAAVRSGFDHLGRFSTEYRALFGERPSETLARRRRSGQAM